MIHHVLTLINVWSNYLECLTLPALSYYTRANVRWFTSTMKDLPSRKTYPLVKNDGKDMKNYALCLNI